MEQLTNPSVTSAETASRRGRRPASEMSEKRALEIARLERIVAAQRERLTKLKEAETKAQRAARRAQLTRLKIAVGGLANIAGLLEEDRGFVLGALLQIREAMSKADWTVDRYQSLKRRGDSELAAREARRKSGNSLGSEEGYGD